MTEFENALLQAAENDFSDIPHDLSFPPIALNKVRKAHILRRTLIIAAAVVVLAGSVLAAYVISYRLGNVDVETDEYAQFHMSIDDDNRYYQITFEKDFANDDAPDRIQDYFLPTKIANAQNLYAPSCRIEQDDFMSFCPLESATLDPEGLPYIPTVSLRNDAMAKEDRERIMSAPTTVFYEWNINDSAVTFSQNLALIAADGTPFIRHVVQDVDTIVTSYRTIRIDEYEVFVFEEDFSNHSAWRDPSNAVSRHWYWTDGDYLFMLSGSLPEAEMLELFRSVKPVSQSFPYRLTDENQIAENFTLTD